MEIKIKEVYCPLCGAPEVQDGKLNVRGFKVERGGLWWSQCISGKPHGSFDAVYEDGSVEDVAFPEKPWFAFRDDGAFVVEIPGHGDVVFSQEDDAEFDDTDFPPSKGDCTVETKYYDIPSALDRYRDYPTAYKYLLDVIERSDPDAFHWADIDEARKLAIQDIRNEAAGK